jgi:hypothetical protein
MDHALSGARRRAETIAVARVKGWVAAALAPDEQRTILVTELACTEPGCPPVETVIALLGRGDRQQWKLHKPLADITEDDVRSAVST